MSPKTPPPFELIPCINCGARADRTVRVVDTRIRHECHLYGVRLRVASCQDCGLVFVNPRPVAASIERLYSAELYEQAKPNVVSRHLPGRVTLQDLYDDLRESLPPLVGKRILDIGANEGRWLSLFDGSNELLGIEPSAAALRPCRDHIKMIRSTLEQAVVHQPIDLVTATALIEHLPDPLHGLVRMNSFLRPGGMVFLYTPNVKEPFLRRGIAKYFKVPHLFYFSVETLTSLLHKAGFAVSSVRTFPPSLAKRFDAPSRGASGSFWILARKVATVDHVEAARRSPTTDRMEHELVTRAIREAIKRDRFLSAVSTAGMLGRRWRNKASGAVRTRFPGAWSHAKQWQLTWKRSTRS